jgi:hypothetical protein
MPFTAYSGPLTAGQSADSKLRRSKGWLILTVPTTAQTTGGAIGAGGSFTGAGYAAPTAAQAAAGETGAYTPASGDVLQQYMTPYLQGALSIRSTHAARRQAEIQAQQLQSQFGKAGAYGGSRQGVAEAELQRGLLDRMAGITGTGYQQAFTRKPRTSSTLKQRRQMRAAQRAS